MRRVVVEQEANPCLRRIALVQLVQQGDKVLAGMVVADYFRDSTGVQVESGQQGYRSQPFVFVVPEMTGELPGLGRSVRRCRRQRLNTRLFVIRDGDNERFYQRAFQQ